MDAAEYKHVVLGLIFLKYISDAFQERYETLKADKLADPEDRDEYTAENVFWVPKDARWAHIQGKAKQTTIGKAIDDAMVAIEKENPSLKGWRLRPKIALDGMSPKQSAREDGHEVADAPGEDTRRATAWAWSLNEPLHDQDATKA